MGVLVTGASGFVGRHLLDLLSAEGEEFEAWGLRPLDSEIVSAVDLLDAGAVASQDLSRVSVVIHLAGLAQVSQSFADPAGYISANATMQANLFEALIAQGASPRVLIVSTGAVYAAGDERLTEESPTAPDSPYAVSKLTQEVLAHYYERRGFDVVLARPFNHVGPGQQRGFIVADVASQIAELERLGGGAIGVGNLQAERDYTDVRDVVRAYLSIARHGETGQVYNVCSGRSRSAQSIVKRLAALASVPVDVVSDPELFRPVDQMTVNAVNTKICEQTGWLPTIDFDQTLADTLDYWRDLERGDLS